MTDRTVVRPEGCAVGPLNELLHIIFEFTLGDNLVLCVRIVLFTALMLKKIVVFCTG